MTEAQKFKFYFPAWNRCVRANGWFTRDGAAVVDEARLNEEGRKVLAIARQRSLATRHSPLATLDDLRHAAHIVALGHDKSSEHLTNAEVDRVVCLFNLLANPNNLSAITQWGAYQRGENPGALKRQNYFIHSRAPDAVLRKLTYDLTSGRTRDPEALDDNERANLARLLAQRGVYGHRPVLERRGRRAEGGGQKSEVGKQTPGGAQSDIRPTASGIRPPSTVSKPNPKNYVLNPQLVFEKGPF
jgi:hypothetical protein